MLVTINNQSFTARWGTLSLTNNEFYDKLSEKALQLIHTL